MPAISIIMPVYNAENSLPRAIDSVLAQTFTDWELICVDDGSIDNTPDILDDYAKRYESIVVIHKDNAGVAMARQDGVNVARGKYSIHIDADDWVESTMLEELYSKAEETGADMVICDYYQNYQDGREVMMSQHPTRLNTKDQIDDIFYGGFFSALWCKLIRHSVYKEYDIRFFPGVNYCEDVLVCVQIMKNTNLNLVYLPNAYYHYVINDSSITHVNSKKYELLLKYKNKLVEILPYNSYKEIIDYCNYNIFIECFRDKGVLSNHEIKVLYKDIASYAYSKSGLRWNIGLFFISLGCYSIARLFIKY